MNRHDLSFPLLSAMLALIGCSAAASQICPPGDLRVFVKDSQEAPIFDVAVRVASDATELATRPTPASGLVEFANLPCGRWSVKASKEGFDDATIAVEIKGNPAVEVTLTMNPRMNRSTMNVTDTPP